VRAGHGRILIVEDHPPLRRLLKTALVARGFQVHACGTAVQALRRLHRASFRVLVTDFQMPGMTGVELIEVVRASGSGIAIILMSTDSPKESGIPAKTLRGVRFLRKPFGLKDLVTAIRRSLRASSR
jgi:DNA-binding response OmpR family regulator